MNRKFVIIAALLTYFISAYFSYSFFSKGGATGSYKITSKPDSKQADNIQQAQQNSEEEFAGPKNEECPINGLMLTKEQKERWETRRPMGVMIENHTEARPQSGLTSADVVYEFVAEGGITRFLTMFYCKDATHVGPVRSARVYFISMVRGYGNSPLYVHVGGANTPGKADALGLLSKIKWAGYNDINQFSVPFPVFARNYERLPGVATEHTMYSSTQKLWKYAADKRKLTNVDEDDIEWDAKFKPWKFKDGKTAQSPSVLDISYEFWEGMKDYSVEWKYDAAKNAYVRSQNGKPHTDKNNDKQIIAYNVVTVLMDEGTVNDGYEKGHHLSYETIGTGKAIIFQNGEAIEGTWKKPKDDDQIRFLDSSGDEVKLVRGFTWVSILPKGNKVNY